MKIFLLTLLMATLISSGSFLRALEVGDQVLGRCGYSFKTASVIAKSKINSKDTYLLSFNDPESETICGKQNFTEATSHSNKRLPYIVTSWPKDSSKKSKPLTYQKWIQGQTYMLQCGYHKHPATITKLSNQGLAKIEFKDKSKNSFCGGWQFLDLIDS